jgi:hypothetical protein
MRTTMVVLGVAAVLALVVLAACRTRDDSAADSALDDSARPDGSATDSVSATDTGSVSSPVPLERASPPSKPKPRRVEDPPRDSALPPEDSLRAMRPKLPQVTPPVKRPGTWRGFKLPEAIPVRPPVETIRRVEQVPDSQAQADSTKPSKPPR